MLSQKKGQELVEKEEALFNEAIDKTGTLLREGLTDSNGSLQGTTLTIAQAPYLENEESSGVSDDLLTIHGSIPGLTVGYTTRLIYDNPEGFNTKISDNDKLKKAKEVINGLGADIAVYFEHDINCRHNDNVNSMGQMLNVGEV